MSKVLIEIDQAVLDTGAEITISQPRDRMIWQVVIVEGLDPEVNAPPQVVRGCAARLELALKRAIDSARELGII